MEIRLSTVDNGVDDAEQVELHTPHGVFRGPDHLVEIIDLTAEPARERTA